MIANNLPVVVAIDYVVIALYYAIVGSTQIIVIADNVAVVIALDIVMVTHKISFLIGRQGNIAVVGNNGISGIRMNA